MCQFQHRAGEGGWRLLGKVVTRVGHLVVYAGPGEVTCRRAAVSGREVAICQAVQGDSRDRDGRLRSKLLLDLVVGRGTGCVSEAMTDRSEARHRRSRDCRAMPGHASRQCRVRMWASFSPRVACRLVDPATGPIAGRCSAARATWTAVAATHR